MKRSRIFRLALAFTAVLLFLAFFLSPHNVAATIGASCNPSAGTRQCDDNEVCDSSSRTCVESSLLGQTCNPSSNVNQCGSYLVCDPTTRTCLTQGEDQTPISDNTSTLTCNPYSGVNQCGSNRVCDTVTRRCVLPPSSIGQSCNSSAGVNQCGSNAVCDPSTNTCVTIPSMVGRSCDPSSGINQCGTYAACDAATKKCISTVENEDKTWKLCQQIPTEKQQTCFDCFNNNGVWTAIGCIPTSPQEIIKTIVTIGMSLAGVVVLILILISAFTLSTSQGDPNKTKEAKEMLTSAIVGLLFIIFSVTILQFIGVSILNIPGFGE